jgi:hypothetical protein
MKLDEALETLKKAGAKTIKESYALTGNVQSYFEIGADVEDVDEWFYNIYTGSVDTEENSSGHAVVHLIGKELLPKSVKQILDKWADDIASFSINIWSE